MKTPSKLQLTAYSLGLVGAALFTALLVRQGVMSVGAAVAGGVNESGFVRLACPVGDDVLSGDRLAGGAVPLFPFTGALWLAVGVQEQVPAHRAASFLLA